VKALIVVQRLAMTGVTRSVLELLPGLAARGIETEVVTFRDPEHGAAAEFAAAGVRIRVVPVDSMVGRVRALRRIIRGDAVDVVHSSSWDAHLPSRLAARLAGVPELTSLVSPASDPGPEQVSSRRRRVVNAASRWSERHLTERFHAVTRSTGDSWVAKAGLDPARITVVERGRDPGRYRCGDADLRTSVRASLGLATDAQVILTVGRQHRQKGQIELLRAFDVLGPQHPRAVVLVAGAEQHAHEQLASHAAASDVGDRVHLLGHRSDVPDLLAAGDVFAFPSIHEGFGGAVLEAMASHLPVVVADLPSMRELVTDGRTGLVVDCRDPELLAAAIARMLDDPAFAASCAERAYQQFVEQYAIEHAAAAMADLYRSVAARASVAGLD
jgi:glycosyltransferase involved in cell wall biosynthesis